MSDDQGDTEQLRREAARPLFIRHPLPWRLFDDGEHDVEVVDRKDAHILSLYSEDEKDLWPDTVKKLNQMHLALSKIASVVIMSPCDNDTEDERLVRGLVLEARHALAGIPKPSAEVAP